MAQIKDLPARSWPLLVDKWIEHIPNEDNLFNAEVTVQKLLHQSGIELSDKEVIEAVPALRQTAFSSAIFLHRKAKYCIDTARYLNGEGFPTWASLSMYDACFFSAKSACYLLGVVDSSRENSFYLDIFYEESRGKKLLDVGHKPYKLKERMTHSMLWEIFPRMMNTLKVEGSSKEYVISFRKTDYKTFSKERNRLFYTCMGWSRQEELRGSDLLNRTVYQKNVDYISDPKLDQSEYHHEYNSGGIYLFDFVLSLLDDIGKSVPLVSSWIEADQYPNTA